MANWIALADVTVGDSTKASSYNNLRNDLDNIKSDVFVKAKDGDQEVVSQDVSKLREFTCSAGSGALFTLISANGDASGQAMKGWSHNFPISAAGAFGARDETEPCYILVITEKGLIQRYDEPSANSPYTAGGTPSFAYSGLVQSFNGMTSGGSGNAQTLDYNIPAYAAGTILGFKAGYINSGATTMNVRGLGTRNIYNQSITALGAGEILAGGYYFLYDDGTRFILMNSSAAPAGVVAAITGSTAGNKLRMITFGVKLFGGGSGTGCTLSCTAVGGVIQPTPTVVAGGANYAIGDVISINGGTTAASAIVASLNGNAVATVTLNGGGSGYSSGTIATTSSFYWSVECAQNSSIGWGFNVSAVQSSAVAYLPFVAVPASASVGSGGTAITYTMSANRNVLTIATAETITSVLCASVCDGGLLLLFSPQVVSPGNINLNVYSSAQSGAGPSIQLTYDKLADTSAGGALTQDGAVRYINIPYMVGGTV